MIFKCKSITEEMYAEFFKSTFFIQIAIAVYSVSDSIVVGQYLGDKALSALTLTMPVFMVLTAVLDMLSLGGSSLFSRANGEGDNDKANSYFSATMATALLIGSMFSFLGLVFIDEFVYLLGARDEFIPLTKAYLSILICGITISIFYTCLDFFARNDGKPTLAMVANAAFIIFNIVFNVILVGYTDIGIAGAAWASIIGEGLALLILICGLYFSSATTLRLTTKIDYKDMLYIVKTGSSVATKYIYKMATVMIFNNLIMHYYHGEGVVIYSVIFNLLMLATAVFEGLRDTIQPIISTYVGEGNNSGIKEAMRITFKIIIVSSLLLVLALELFPEYGAYLFGVYDQQLISQISEGVRIYALVIPFITFNEVMSYYYNFINHSKMTVYIMTAKGLIVVLPCNILLLYLGGLNGLWAGFVLTEIITLLLIFLWAKQIAKKDKRDLSQLLLLDKQMDTNSIIIPLQADKAYFSQTMERVESFLDQQGIEQNKKFRVMLSVEESVMNVIDHKQAKEAGLIEIQLIIAKEITLVIRDNCHTFDPTKYVSDGVMTSGLGIKLMSGAANEFSYVPTIGYNRVIFTF